MDIQRQQNYMILGFLLLSLLIHLLLLLIPKDRLFPPPEISKPVYVEVRPPQRQERELDIPVRPELEKPREKPAKRLGPADQVVEQETAPEGRDTEDMKPQAASRPTPPQPESKPAPETPKTEAKQQEKAVKETKSDRRSSPTGTQPAQAKPPQPQPQPQTQPTPDLTKLTQLTPQTVARLEQEWRQKYREDVAKGDTVWLDAEQDILWSFFKRLRDGIYGVWRYPSAAAARQEKGTCLIKITFDRKGVVQNVQLLESTGFSTLDQAAMDAVRKGQPYGPLHSAYPNDHLNVMALFKYQSSSSRLPGRVY